MTKFIGVMSVKGGVGKTTTSINLSYALDWFRRDVILLDANFANPDVGMHLGKPYAEKTIHSALKGKHHISESIYRHPSGLKIIPGHMSYHEAKKTQRENLMNVILDLSGSCEAVIVDSTPGIGAEAKAVIKAVDYVLIVTTPDLCSVANSIKMAHMAKEYNKDILGIIVNKVTGDYTELDIENIETMIGSKVIGVIPEDHKIRTSLHHKNPVISMHPDSPAATSYKKLAAILIGEKYADNLAAEEAKKETQFKKIMKKIGF